MSKMLESLRDGDSVAVTKWVMKRMSNEARESLQEHIDSVIDHSMTRDAFRRYEATAMELVTVEQVMSLASLLACDMWSDIEMHYDKLKAQKCDNCGKNLLNCHCAGMVEDE